MGGQVMYIGDGPPASPVVGQTWWESDTGNMFVYYDDGTSVQWVPAHVGALPSGGTGGVEEAPTDGQTYGRQSSAWTVISTGGGSMTGAEILTALAPVDGSGSGLDADLLDGQTGSYYSSYANLTGKPSTFPPTLPIAESDVTNLVTDLAAKAPLASPAFTGNPTAPTATAGDNDTSIATTAFVTAADTALKSVIVGSASSGWDTLGEIENWAAANVTAVLPNKADLFDPTFTGTPDVPTAAAGTNTTQIASTAFVTAAIAAKITNKITVASSAPSSPSTNDVWIDTT
jgi:hypothetical protein